MSVVSICSITSVCAGSPQGCVRPENTCTSLSQALHPPTHHDVHDSMPQACLLPTATVSSSRVESLLSNELTSHCAVCDVRFHRLNVDGLSSDEGSALPTLAACHHQPYDVLTVVRSRGLLSLCSRSCSRQGSRSRSRSRSRSLVMLMRIRYACMCFQGQPGGAACVWRR